MKWHDRAGKSQCLHSLRTKEYAQWLYRLARFGPHLACCENGLIGKQLNRKQQKKCAYILWQVLFVRPLHNESVVNVTAWERRNEAIM